MVETQASIWEASCGKDKSKECHTTAEVGIEAMIDCISSIIADNARNDLVFESDNALLDSLERQLAELRKYGEEVEFF